MQIAFAILVFMELKRLSGSTERSTEIPNLKFESYIWNVYEIR